MSISRLSFGAILALGGTGVIVSVLAASLFMAYQAVPNVGVVKAVGVSVYWNRDCTKNVTQINWGYLEPGDTSNVTVYIMNEGNIPLVLTMRTEDWNPASASSCIGLTWNREEYVLKGGSTVSSVFTLSLDPEIEGITDFSFDILIIGAESTYS